jgi:hypothetical protein
MTRVRGGWESLIPLSNPQNLANGVTYADGKLRSRNSNIAETPFSISTGERDFKLTGKIVLEYPLDECQLL